MLSKLGGILGYTLATEYYKNFDAIVLVSCPDELRISRVMQRDGVDRMTVISRMKAQPDFESLLDRVTHLIDNSGDQSLEDQVGALLVDLLGHSDLYTQRPNFIGAK